MHPSSQGSRMAPSGRANGGDITAYLPSTLALEFDPIHISMEAYFGHISVPENYSRGLDDSFVEVLCEGMDGTIDRRAKVF